jgi:hypothetical protein
MQVPRECKHFYFHFKRLRYDRVIKEVFVLERLCIQMKARTDGVRKESRYLHKTKGQCRSACATRPPVRPVSGARLAIVVVVVVLVLPVFAESWCRGGVNGLDGGTSTRARFWDSKVVDKAGSLDTKTAGGKRLPDGADVNTSVPVLVSLNPSITRVSH